MNIILVWQEMQEEDRREAHRWIACAAAIGAIVVCSLFLLVTSADALQADDCQMTCSFPYVTDVNPCGTNAYFVTVSCAGNVDKLKVNKKQPKKIDRRTWVFKAKAGKLYKISAKPRHGKSKSISYRIER